MRFYPLLETGKEEAGRLDGEYRDAREIGKVRMGELHLFFKAGLKTYFIAYHDVRRLFRRVEAVPFRMCCGRGTLEVENLVVCGEGDRELAQIQLPGKKAAQILMKELEERVPEAQFGRPVQN